MRANSPSWAGTRAISVQIFLARFFDIADSSSKASKWRQNQGDHNKEKRDDYHNKEKKSNQGKEKTARKRELR